MEFDELLITTGVDALVRLVKEKEKIELEEAAQALNIPESTIEEWARILEEEGIVRIEYKLTKIFLNWIKPSEEEMAKERESFYQERAGIQKETVAIQDKLKPNLNELAQLQGAFAKISEKLYPRLEALEKSLSTLPKDQLLPVLQDFQSQIDKIQGSINNLRGELTDFSGQTPKQAPSKRSSDISGFADQLKELEKRAEKMKKTVPAELPGAKEIENKVQELREEFRDIQKREAKIKEDFRGMGETTELIQEMRGQLEKYSQSIAPMQAELANIQGQLKAVRDESIRFDRKVREEQEAMSRFNDSIGVAKGILSRYPSQSDVLKELERMSEKEKLIDDKMAAIEKLLGALGGPKQLVQEFSSLKESITEMREGLQNDAGALEQAMAEQKDMYSTFEKIREKATTSIESYDKQLALLRTQLVNMQKQGEQLDSAWETQAKEWSKKIKEKDFQDLFTIAKDAGRKRELLQEIEQSLAKNIELAENLSKRLNLLGQEAKLLELRTGASAPAPTKEAEQAVRQQLTLTKQEEEEFSRKREELRDLIKKLWEES